MGFEERKKYEDEYISYWINKNPNWKINPVGVLPDLTKPDGTYQDIKFVDIHNKYNNGFLIAQKKGIVGSEIDDWNESHILDKCEYKFILVHKNEIYIINCKTFLNNVFKECDEREPTEKYSGTPFYIVDKNDFNWKKIDDEYYQDKCYNVYLEDGNRIKKNHGLNEWM